MKKNIFISSLLLSVTATIFSQVFTNFSVKGSIVEARIKNTAGKIETIVDETVDIKNLDFKYRLNSGTSVSDSTPIVKDFTKPQYIKLVNGSEGKQTWEVAVNQLKGAALPLELSFSGSSPIDIKTPNPKAWAGYGIDYKRADAIYFCDEGAAFYIAINAGAKVLSYTLSLLAKEALAGEFSVECSTDYKKWSTLANYSSTKSITQNNTFTHTIKPEVRCIRWVYYTRDKQNVVLNSIMVK